jgi:hypothetical protein
MNRFKALQNPFLLVAEGFVAGAILFLSITPGASHSLLRHVPHHSATATHR